MEQSKNVIKVFQKGSKLTKAFLIIILIIIMLYAVGTYFGFGIGNQLYWFKNLKFDDE